MQLKNCIRSIIMVVIGIVTIYIVAPQPASAAAGINQQLTFQGKVVKSDGTNLPDGTYNMEFKVYQDGDGQSANDSTGTPAGSLKWTEDYLVSGSSGMPATGGMTVTSGTFNVNLGSLCSLSGGTCGAKSNTGIDFNQNTLWLSFQVGNSTACTVTSAATSFNTACGGDGEMLPMIRLTAVPQAMNSNAVGGLSASQLVQLNPSSQQSGTVNVSGNITTGGSVQANTVDAATSNTTLVIGSTNTSSISLGKSASLGAGYSLTLQGSNALILGSTSAVGGIVFQDGTTNNRTVTLSAAALTGAYSISLPTAGPATNQCLASGGTTASQLTWTTCGGISTSTLQQDYNNSGTTNPQIALSAAYGGLKIQDALLGIGSNLFSVANSGGGTTYFAVAATGVTTTGLTASGAVTANSTVLVQPASDSATEFTVKQSSAGGGTSLLTVNTSNGLVQIGSATSDSAQVDLALDQYNGYADKNASCNSATDPNGALYYNSISNSVRGCINGGWEDLVSTTGLGIMLYGVVADSANATTPGDWLGSGSANGADSPCKVTYATATTVSVSACTLFANGRKAIVAATTLGATTGLTGVSTTNVWAHVCINSSGVPVWQNSTAYSVETSGLPTFNANSPPLCLADVKLSTAVLGTITNIYDVRTFTQTTKTFGYAGVATGLGMAVSSYTTLTNNTVTAQPNPTTSKSLLGVAALSDGAVAGTTPNLIIALSGPEWVKATSATATGSTVEYMSSGTTAGYTAPTTTASYTYTVLGLELKTADTLCTGTSNCQYSAATLLNIH